MLSNTSGLGKIPLAVQANVTCMLSFSRRGANKLSFKQEHTHYMDCLVQEYRKADHSHVDLIKFDDLTT